MRAGRSRRPSGYNRRPCRDSAARVAAPAAARSARGARGGSAGRLPHNDPDGIPTLVSSPDGIPTLVSSSRCFLDICTAGRQMASDKSAVIARAYTDGRGAVGCVCMVGV
eukprot:scaffold63372_cov75-Phaeocystis_antarctica.AAC.4